MDTTKATRAAATIPPIDEDEIPEGENVSRRFRKLGDAVSELRKKYSFKEILFAVVDVAEDEELEATLQEEPWKAAKLTDFAHALAFLAEDRAPRDGEKR